MVLCPDCTELRRKHPSAPPHRSLALMISADRSVASLAADTRDMHYLCRDCGATFIRGAMDDNSEPVWELYAG
jgi:hypothetical protein